MKKSSRRTTFSILTLVAVFSIAFCGCKPAAKKIPKDRPPIAAPKEGPVSSGGGGGGGSYDGGAPAANDAPAVRAPKKTKSKKKAQRKAPPKPASSNKDF